MKSLIFVFLSFFALSSCAYAGENDWTKSEHNYNLKYKDFGVNIRQYHRDDYAHAEFKYKIKPAGQKVEVALRIAEDTGSSREYRPKLTHKLFKWNPLSTEDGKGPLSVSFGHRIEYRSYELASKDDYWRYRSISKLKYKLDKNYAIWAKAQPRWIFQKDGESNDFKIDDIKTNLGLDIKLDGVVTFSPYVEMLLNGADENYAKKSLMFGTALSFKF